MHSTAPNVAGSGVGGHRPKALALTSSSCHGPVVGGRSRRFQLYMYDATVTTAGHCGNGFRILWHFWKGWHLVSTQWHSACAPDRSGRLHGRHVCEWAIQSQTFVWHL